MTAVTPAILRVILYYREGVIFYTTGSFPRGTPPQVVNTC